jgi:hypothetical protein
MMRSPVVDGTYNIGTCPYTMLCLMSTMLQVLIEPSIGTHPGICEGKVES